MSPKPTATRVWTAAVYGATPEEIRGYIAADSFPAEVDALLEDPMHEAEISEYVEIIASLRDGERSSAQSHNESDRNVREHVPAEVTTSLAKE